MIAPDIDSLFEHLDNWRYLPSYRLEPRTDVFFGLFLPQALDRHLAPRGVRIDPRLIPEFPLGQNGTMGTEPRCSAHRLGQICLRYADGNGKKCFGIHSSQVQ